MWGNGEQLDDYEGNWMTVNELNGVIVDKGRYVFLLVVRFLDAAFISDSWPGERTLG